MKRTTASLAVLALMVVLTGAAAPRPAAAAVTGNKYEIFIYSQYVAEPAATITFKADGVLLISAYSGFGRYFPLSNGVAAVFSAPEVEKNKDLFMVMIGLLLGDFLSGTGITLTNGVFSEVFFFSGYAAAS